jgi:archaellum component FlaC
VPESLEVKIARMEERSESILRELERVSKDVTTFAPVAGQLIEAIAELHSLRDDFAEIKPQLQRAVLDLTKMQAEQGRQREVLSNRQKWLYGIATLLIGGGIGIVSKLLGF